MYVEAGFAYVPRDQLITLLQGRFRSSLSKELIHAFQQLPLIYDDSAASFTMLASCMLQDFQYVTTKAKCGKVDGFANEGYMPACIGKLRAALERDHHDVSGTADDLVSKGIGLP